MGERGRVPALDGLRGVAILLVVASHAGAPGMRHAGAAGVALFFVLSGYLITGQLLERPRLSAFYLRRGARLIPALVVTLVLASALLGYAFWRAGALAYVSNWTTRPLPLDHLWSLAVEEQFYLVWPFVLLLPRRWLVQAVTAIVVTSLVLRFSLDPERAYHGTDTTACVLGLGALLALRPVAPSRLLPAVGAAVVAVAALTPWPGDGLTPALTASTVAACGGGLLLTWRGQPPRWLTYCGDVSYGWYLWHFPLIAALTSVEYPDLALGVIAGAAAFGAAAASRRWVEEPVRRWAAVRARELDERHAGATIMSRQSR